MFTETFHVRGISCKQCKLTIERELLGAAGVSAVAVDLAAKRVTISYDDPATSESLVGLLNEIGYPTEATHG